MLPELKINYNYFIIIINRFPPTVESGLVCLLPTISSNQLTVGLSGNGFPFRGHHSVTLSQICLIINKEKTCNYLLESSAHNAKPTTFNIRVITKPQLLFYRASLI